MTAFPRPQISSFAALAGRRKGGLLIAPVLIALILFAQTVELVHSHGGTLEPQFDCEICLKLGSHFKAAIGSSFEFDLVSFSPEILPTEAPGFSHTSTPVSARGPPQTLTH